MFSKKLFLAFLSLFIFLSFVSLIVNMPEKKNKRVYKEILKDFPYKIKKEFGGLDIVDKRTNKDLDVANSKVFLIFDDLLKKWGKEHLILQKNNLLVLDNNKKVIRKIELKNQKEIEFIKKFFKF